MYEDAVRRLKYKILQSEELFDICSAPSFVGVVKVRRLG
jgi:hypothetical protein